MMNLSFYLQISWIIRTLIKTLYISQSKVEISSPTKIEYKNNCTELCLIADSNHEQQRGIKMSLKSHSSFLYALSIINFDVVLDLPMNIRQRFHNNESLLHPVIVLNCVFMFQPITQYLDWRHYRKYIFSSLATTEDN